MHTSAVVHGGMVAGEAVDGGQSLQDLGLLAAAGALLLRSVICVAVHYPYSHD